MNLIVAVDKNWAIGRDGDLLIHIPGDMQFFRSKTVGGTVILGRRTLESFPGGRPLPDRENIVLSRNPEYRPEGVRTVRDKDEALALTAGLAPESVWVIGGAQIYREFLDCCEKAYVTRVDHAFDGADVWFPNLDERADWELTREGALMEYQGIPYRFCIYSRRS